MRTHDVLIGSTVQIITQPPLRRDSMQPNVIGETATVISLANRWPEDDLVILSYDRPTAERHTQIRQYTVTPNTGDEVRARHLELYTGAIPIPTIPSDRRLTDPHMFEIGDWVIIANWSGTHFSVDNGDSPTPRVGVIVTTDGTDTYGVNFGEGFTRGHNLDGILPRGSTVGWNVRGHEIVRREITVGDIMYSHGMPRKEHNGISVRVTGIARGGTVPCVCIDDPSENIRHNATLQFDQHHLCFHPNGGKKRPVQKPSADRSLRIVNNFINASNNDPEVTLKDQQVVGSDWDVSDFGEHKEEIKRHMGRRNTRHCCIYADGNTVWSQFSVCHGDLEEYNRYEKADATYIVTALQGEFTKENQGLTDEQQAFYIWLFNDSLYADVFITKKPSQAYSTGVVLSCDHPSHLVATACMAVRYGYEESAFKAYSWYQMVDMGFDMTQAFVLSHYFIQSDIEDTKNFIRFEHGDHVVLEPHNNGPLGMKNWLANTPAHVDKENYAQSKTYDMVYLMWGKDETGVNALDETLDKYGTSCVAGWDKSVTFNREQVKEACTYILKEHIGVDVL